MLTRTPIDASNSAKALKLLFSNKFLNDFFKKNKLNVAIKSAHQRKINACTTVPHFKHVNNTTQVIDVITNQNIAAEQEKLLANYVQNINTKMVDIDYLTLAVNLTENDIAALFSEEKAVLNVKTKARSSRLNVTLLAAKNKNQGFKTGDIKPFFTKCFRIIVDNDAHKYVNIYYADKSHPKNSDRTLTHNLEIEFIPSRFAPGTIDLIFLHLKSVFKANRYPQIIKHARVLRLDLGLNMFGVSQLFCFIDSINKKVSSGSCYPDDADCLAMTTNLGSENHSCAVLYDKVAKELTKFFEEVSVGLQENINDLLQEVGNYEKAYRKLLPTARYESKHRNMFYLHHHISNKKVSITVDKLDQIVPEFGNTAFVKPTMLSKIKPAVLKQLVRNKSYGEIYKLRAFLETEDAYLKFDYEQVRTAFSPHLCQLQVSILDPKKIDCESGSNYTQLADAARNSLLPFQKQLHDRCSDQEAIIKSDIQNIYVEGTPGSGKTTLMINRVSHLLEQGVSQENICVLAFTREAAKHFKSELLKKFPSAQHVSVSTFSRWCNQLVKKTDNLKILNADRAKELINQIIDQIGTKEICKSESLRNKIIRVINYSTNYSEPHVPTSIKKIAPELTQHEEVICKIFKYYTKCKLQNLLQDFNDIMLNMASKLENAESAKFIAKQTKYIFLDEAQDSNDVQWKILMSLSKQHANIFCVGDPAQSIYGFRGAKVKALENFTLMFNNSIKFTLRKCYRSNNGIVNFCNAIRKGISETLSLAISDDQSQYLPKVKAVNDFEAAKFELLRDLKKIKTRKPDSSILILAPYKKMVSELEEAATIISADMDITFTNTHKGKGLEADITFIFDTSLGRGKLSTRKKEKCNLYVACSRARHRMKIFYNPSQIPYYDTSKGQSKKASTNNILHDIHESLYK